VETTAERSSQLALFYLVAEHGHDEKIHCKSESIFVLETKLLLPIDPELQLPPGRECEAARPAVRRLRRSGGAGAAVPGPRKAGVAAAQRSPRSTSGRATQRRGEQH